jgi:hypothetical protein
MMATAPAPQTFGVFVSAAAPPLPDQLPMVHVTDSCPAAKVLETGEIQNRLCSRFNENLAYFFYGRSSYRSRLRKPTNVVAWAPVAFVLKFDPSAHQLKRVYPFDTGAFIADLYSKYLHTNLRLSDFELQADIAEAQRCVKTFFVSNEAYERDRPISVPYPASNFAVDCFSKLIMNGGEDDIDDRRSCVELQLGAAVSLRDSVIHAVVVPECLLDDPEFVELVRSTCRVEPLGYRFIRANSHEWYGALGQTVSSVVREAMSHAKN